MSLTVLETKKILHHTETTKWITKEEYYEKYYEDPNIVYEWCNGILVEKEMGDFGCSELFTFFLQLLL